MVIKALITHLRTCNMIISYFKYFWLHWRSFADSRFQNYNFERLPLWKIRHLKTRILKDCPLHKFRVPHFQVPRPSFTVFVQLICNATESRYSLLTFACEMLIRSHRMYLMCSRREHKNFHSKRQKEGKNKNFLK